MIILLLQDAPHDTCFHSTPLGHNSGQHTGASSVGHELWAGVECRFIVGYYDYEIRSFTVLTSNCTIQSKKNI